MLKMMFKKKILKNLFLSNKSTMSNCTLIILGTYEINVQYIRPGCCPGFDIMGIHGHVMDLLQFHAWSMAKAMAMVLCFD